jgi:hypothetical protein
MTKFKRVFKHYEELEEYHAGMWRIIRGEERKAFIAASANLMRNSKAFKSAMRLALVQWPVSCEVALTADGVNHIAFLGHAGCCIGTGSPEECTRAGWHTLNSPEQDEANRVAAEVLEEWVKRYAGNVIDLFSWRGPNA